MSWDYMRYLGWRARAWTLGFGFALAVAAFAAGWKVRGSDNCAVLAIEAGNNVLNKLDTLVARQCGVLDAALLPGLCR